MNRTYSKYAALNGDLCQDQMTQYLCSMTTQHNYRTWDDSPCQIKQSHCQKLLLHLCCGAVATLSVWSPTIHHSSQYISHPARGTIKKIDNRGYSLPPVVSNMHKQLNDGNPLVMTTFCENQHEGVPCPSTTKNDLSAMV